MRLSKLAFLLIVAVSMALMPGTAHADGLSLGEIFNKFQTDQLKYVVLTVSTVAFLIGLILVGGGLMKMKEAADSSGTHVKYSDGLLRLGAGAFLMSLATTAVLGLETIGANEAWDFTQIQKSNSAGGSLGAGAQAAGNGACAAGGVSSASCGVAASEAYTIMANFAVNAAGPLTSLTMGLCVAIGLALVSSALLGFSKLGSAHAKETPGAVTVKFLVGIAMINSKWLLDSLTQTLLGTTTTEKLLSVSQNALTAYNKATSATDVMAQCASIKELAMLALIPFGVIAVIKGFLMVKDAVEGRHNVTVGQGFTHIAGGIALVNANTFIPAVASMLGSTVCG
jgi:hypothetical protein